MMTDEYTLEGLEKLSGLSIRTLRYYIQEGLLPGPDTRGKNARYSHDHLDIIRFIERFKEVNMPLKQIRHLLETMSSEEIERIISSRLDDNLIFLNQEISKKETTPQTKREDQKRSSALEYIRNLENLQETMKVRDRNTIVYNSPALPQAPVQPKPASKFQQYKHGESWQRIQLADGLELQVRRPTSKKNQQMVDEILETIQQLFKNT